MAACLFLPVTHVTKSASVKAINDQFKMSAVFRQLHVRTVPATSAPFYRAMHFSAKRGIAIACRLSVRPSVCLSVCL